MKVWLGIVAGLLGAGVANAQDARFSVAEFSVAAPKGWSQTPAPRYSFVEFKNPHGADRGRLFVTVRDRFGHLDDDVALDRNLAWSQKPNFLSKVSQIQVAGADCRQFTAVAGLQRTDRIYCALSVPDGVDRKQVTFMITSDGTSADLAARTEALKQVINSVRWGREVDW